MGCARSMLRRSDAPIGGGCSSPLRNDPRVRTHKLSLYYADDLVGPWQPHSLNPVVRDVRTARPAGRIIVNSHGHIRPGQDCSTRYGAAITLNRILELSPDSYIERSFARIRPPRTLGAHCVDSDGQVTVLDISVPRPRLAEREWAKPPSRETVNDTGDSLYTCPRAFLPSRIKR